MRAKSFYVVAFNSARARHEWSLSTDAEHVFCFGQWHDADGKCYDDYGVIVFDPEVAATIAINEHQQCVLFVDELKRAYIQETPKPRSWLVDKVNRTFIRPSVRDAFGKWTVAQSTDKDIGDYTYVPSIDATYYVNINAR